MAVLARGDAPRGEALAVAHAVDVVDDRHLGIARQQEIGVQRMRRRGASTVRTAATSAWPITWPPNTRCQPACGERPRNRLTSSCSRSRISSRSWTADGHGMGAWPVGGQIRASTCYAGPSFTRKPRWQSRPDGATRKTDLRDRAAAGFAGLALAIALRQGLGESFAVTVADPGAGATRNRRTRAPRRSRPPRGGCSRRSGLGRGRRRARSRSSTWW